MIYRPRDSRAVSAWVRDCRGAYTHGGETVCPGFYVYRGFVGCPAWAAAKPCSYCYLRTTFNGQRDPTLREGVAWVDPCGPCRGTGKVGYSPEFGRGPVCDRCDGAGIAKWPRVKATSNARAAVEKWLALPGDPYCANLGDCDKPRFDPLGDECLTCGDLGQIANVLNVGELDDSFGFPPDQNPHIAMLLDLFSSPETNPHGHKVLFVTKAGLEATQAHLDGRGPSDNVILSWSVGDGGDMEPYWPYVSARGGRFHAAGWAQGQGWRVRLRIDPITTNDDLSLHKHVREMLSAPPCVFEVDLLDCLTLGCLRHRGGRQKETTEYRAAVYAEVITTARYSGYEGPIGLCKETPDLIGRVLGIEPGEMRCNCLP